MIGITFFDPGANQFGKGKLMVWNGNIFSSKPAGYKRAMCNAAVVLVCALGVLLPTRGWSQHSAQQTVIVDQYPVDRSSSAASPPAKSTATSDDIKGVRIEPNGALITGRFNEHKVYIKLDSAVLPLGLRGVWVANQALCSPAREAAKSRPGHMPDGSILLTDRQFFGRRNDDIQEVYVPIPDSFTLDILNSGRRLILPASDYHSASKVLIILSSPDKDRIYMQLSLSDKGKNLTVESQNGPDVGSRCDPQ